MPTQNKLPRDEISFLIREMRGGSEVAATQLWEHYWDRLLRISKSRLTGLGSRMADEEDVAISAFHSFVKRMRRGDYSAVKNRDEAWRLLVVITVRKAINLVRDAKRQRRNPHFRSDSENSRGHTIFTPRADDLSVVGLQRGSKVSPACPRKKSP